MTTTPLPPMPDSCWPVDTSCVDGWDDETGGGENGDEPRYSETDKALAVALAGQTMRMLTAYRVGGCPTTVRPCTSACRVRSGASGPGWAPVSLGGRWLNIGCGHVGGCGCLSTREVRLPASAGGVTNVTLDGLTLDPSAYRLDSGGRLVRIDGDGWPLTNDLTAAEGAPGTWSVTYVPGAAVDGIGAAMAGRLAAQYVQACSGESCDLPKSVVTQVQRNGVTLVLAPGAFPDGKTGLRDVDAYLARWNPHALTMPPLAWSPDLTTYR